VFVLVEYTKYNLQLCNKHVYSMDNFLSDDYYQYFHIYDNNVFDQVLYKMYILLLYNKFFVVEIKPFVVEIKPFFVEIKPFVVEK
jgi:hypothetical protein